MYNKKCITRLKTKNNIEITESQKISQNRLIYTSLYTSTNYDPYDDRFDEFFDSPNLKTVSQSQAQSCEGLLLKEDCFKTLKQCAKCKTPGTDGLSSECYLAFWDVLGQELVDSFNYVFKVGEMSISQRRGVISLIPKKTKDETLLENWRPISLLNTDYKIATKTIATRLPKVLPSTVHTD